MTPNTNESRQIMTCITPSPVKTGKEDIINLGKVGKV